jgi:hypothetical protein
MQQFGDPLDGSSLGAHNSKNMEDYILGLWCLRGLLCNCTELGGDLLFLVNRNIGGGVDYLGSSSC